MANKRNTSQARKNSGSSGTRKLPAGKLTAEPGEKIKIPSRFISATVSLVLFFIFLIMMLTDEGLIVKFFKNIILGLMGKVSYYLCIPGFLYLFSIHAFSSGRPVKMRTICLFCFIVTCGCIAHLAYDTRALPSGMPYVTALYRGGINGSTGGLICGLIATLLRWLLYDWISLILLIICAIFTLLGSMQITVPSLVRAIENRPRAEWESEEALEAQPEPAAVVVNHIANKRIEMIENRRKSREERVNVDIPLDGEKRPKPMSPKERQLFSQIDDIDGPVAAASTPVTDVDDTTYNSAPVKEKKKSRPVVSHKKEEPEAPKSSATSGMPLLEWEEDEDADSSFDSPAPAVAEPVPEKVTAKDTAINAALVAQEIAENAAVEKPVYCFPPIDLLTNARRAAADGTAEMRENTRRLNETLASFKIEAHIINVTRGPSVTRYEVELEKGVRLNKLTTVADDIALSLGASGVRIAAVPGKISVVGIEVPNRAVTTVSLREVIDSPEFNKAKSKSSFAVGKDIAGNCIVGNISKLPHMLIAGTTGSGKSVCMNSIIISLLYKASPDDVKMIMVDPKMVELGIYNSIPHLLIPVVTDPKKAAGSLQWAVTEMMRRYKAMSDAGVRDLESYNSIVEAEEDGTRLPQIVVVIDELADLMLVAAKEVEESICRIAQMGRAAGIHLIIATQRPSADVITGLMKANIPSRIAFAVASAMESRIILDTQGAEKLVGKGDMLFAPIGNGKPLRVQGCFVSDPEVEAVANYVKENYNTHYDQTIMEEIERKAIQTGNKATAADPEPNAEELEGDEMLPAAVDVILETGQASVSMLQRRLKLGYARAARIVDEMEEKGIVGPFQGSKPRTILVTKEQWEARKGGSGQMDFDDLDDYGGVPKEI